jgi:hypothetical protein
MPSFSGKLSEPFWRETAWRVVACSSSGVAGNASPPSPAAQVYQVSFSPLPFAFFRVFRGQFFSSLLSCPFGAEKPRGLAAKQAKKTRKGEKKF